MIVKELCNQLIKEGVCSGKTPVNKTRPDLCIYVRKCPILDREINVRWGKTRK